MFTAARDEVSPVQDRIKDMVRSGLSKTEYNPSLGREATASDCKRSMDPGVKTNTFANDRLGMKGSGTEKAKRGGHASRESGVERTWFANLPTCFRKTGDLHPEHGAARTRSSGAIWWPRKSLLASGTTSKLYCQSLTLKITAIWSNISKVL